MTDQTQKLEKFKQAVFDEAAVKAEEIIKETQEYCAQTVAQAKAEAEELIRTSRAKVDKEVREATQRTQSAGRLESRRVVLTAREEIIGRVFANVREKLAAFRQTADYEALLVKRAKECADAYPDKKGEVRLAAADMKYADKLTCGGRFTVCESGNILLGGLMVVYPEDNLAVDCTFDNEYNRQKSGFAGKAGLSIEP
ncbi:V-type ATP synthase subunit E [uncultured Ruminococcus sp.]|uniref:V-type ATP synthase subunit E n=1 Tax=uncultured Ruminococcus sp. TaxID=165186 RepID=UPI000EC5157A|nr:V-type ATP synthase subunit E [uncultured Ruminococcus sp.]HCJ40448.1 ATPase [Ruminococcus sp.]